MWFDSRQTRWAKEKLSKISRLRHCRPSAWPLNIFVPRLSMIRVLMLSLLIHSAVIRPAGPAPTMRTSTLEVLGGGSPMVKSQYTSDGCNEFIDTLFTSCLLEELRHDVALLPRHIDAM